MTAPRQSYILQYLVMLLVTSIAVIAFTMLAAYQFHQGNWWLVGLNLGFAMMESWGVIIAIRGLSDADR